MRYDHLGMLPLRAFRPTLKNQMTLEGGGKDNDTPDPPDYEAQARTQAQGNLEMARLTTMANRPDEFTPLGSRTWQQSADNPDRWISNINLSREGQNLFDSDLRMKQQYADLANAGFGQVEQSLKNLGLDESRLVQNPIDPGQSVLDAYMNRAEPMFNRQREALETQLSNQGIFRGSKAWENAIDEIGRQQNDARIQAAKESIAQGMQARQMGIQEQFAMQDRPLNITNALRTGSQVALPQFQAFAQQNPVAGPDLLGAAQAQYGAGLDAYNIKQGQSNSFMNGLFGLGGAYLASSRPLPF